MLKRLTRLLAVVGVALFATTTWAAAEYGYPLKDKYAATVVGTPESFQADLPKTIPFKRHRITIFPDRQVPDALWYDAEMLYSAAMQDDAAPVVFLIAGTGASHNGGNGPGILPGRFSCNFSFLAYLPQFPGIGIL